MLGSVYVGVYLRTLTNDLHCLVSGVHLHAQVMQINSAQVAVGGTENEQRDCYNDRVVFNPR